MRSLNSRSTRLVASLAVLASMALIGVTTTLSPAGAFDRPHATGPCSSQTGYTGAPPTLPGFTNNLRDNFSGTSLGPNWFAQGNYQPKSYLGWGDWQQSASAETGGSYLDTSTTGIAAQLTGSDQFGSAWPAPPGTGEQTGGIIQTDATEMDPSQQASSDYVILFCMAAQATSGTESTTTVAQLTGAANAWPPELDMYEDYGYHTQQTPTIHWAGATESETAGSSSSGQTTLNLSSGTVGIGWYDTVADMTNPSYIPAGTEVSSLAGVIGSSSVTLTNDLAGNPSGDTIVFTPNTTPYQLSMPAVADTATSWNYFDVDIQRVNHPLITSVTVYENGTLIGDWVDGVGTNSGRTYYCANVDGNINDGCVPWASKIVFAFQTQECNCTGSSDTPPNFVQPTAGHAELRWMEEEYG
jgi:hypothetical protein